MRGTSDVHWAALGVTTHAGDDHRRLRRPPRRIGSSATWSSSQPAAKAGSNTSHSPITKATVAPS